MKKFRTLFSLLLMGFLIHGMSFAQLTINNVDKDVLTDLQTNPGYNFGNLETYQVPEMPPINLGQNAIPPYKHGINNTMEKVGTSWFDKIMQPHGGTMVLPYVQSGEVLALSVLFNGTLPGETGRMDMVPQNNNPATLNSLSPYYGAYLIEKDGGSWGLVKDTDVEKVDFGGPVYYGSAALNENLETVAFATPYPLGDFTKPAKVMKNTGFSNDWSELNFTNENVFYPKAASTDDGVLHVVAAHLNRDDENFGSVGYFRYDNGWDEEVILNGPNSFKEYQVGLWSPWSYTVAAEGDYVVLIFVNQFGQVVFFRSTDGGATWEDETLGYQTFYDAENLYADLDADPAWAYSTDTIPFPGIYLDAIAFDDGSHHIVINVSPGIFSGPATWDDQNNRYQIDPQRIMADGLNLFYTSAGFLHHYYDGPTGNIYNTLTGGPPTGDSYNPPQTAQPVYNPFTNWSWIRNADRTDSARIAFVSPRINDSLWGASTVADPMLAKDMNGDVYLLYTSTVDSSEIDGTEDFGTLDNFGTEFRFANRHIYATKLVEKVIGENNDQSSTKWSIPNRITELGYDNAFPGVSKFIPMLDGEPYLPMVYVKDQAPLNYLLEDILAFNWSHYARGEAFFTNREEPEIMLELIPFDVQVSVDEEESPITGEAKLYPNPANMRATLEFSVDNAGLYTIEVYNSMGQKIMGVFEGTLQPGQQRVILPTGELNSGVYYCKITSNDKSTAVIMSVTR